MTRLKYDECAFHDQVARSEAPFDYVTDLHKFQHPSACVPPYGIMGGTTVTKSPSAVFVDLETTLMNRTRAATRCPVQAPPLRAPDPDIRMCAPVFERPYVPADLALKRQRDPDPRVIVQPQ